MIAELNFISTRMKKLENSLCSCVKRGQGGGGGGFLLKRGGERKAEEEGGGGGGGGVFFLNHVPVLPSLLAKKINTNMTGEEGGGGGF